MDPLPFPCLALYQGADTPKPTFFDIFEEAEIECGIDSLKNNNKKLWSTPQGWILVRDAAATTTFLQNPEDSKHKVQLPHLPEDLPSKSTCVLSGNPTIPGCVALLIEPFATVIWYIHVGDDHNEWTRHEYDIGTQVLDPPLDGKDHEKVPIYSIAACQGKFYFNSRLSDIGVLEFSPMPVFSSLELAGEFEDVYRAKVFLVESGEELYMVMLVYRGFDSDATDYETRVYMMDFSKKQWCRVDDLAGRAFLLAPWYFGAACLASDLGLHEDCVYAFIPGDDENPEDSKHKVQLPHLPEDLPSKSTCVLSGNPTIPGCVALLVEPFATVIWYIHVGDDHNEWEKHEYDIGTQVLDPPLDGKDHEKVPICSIAACQGKFYFNGRLSDIGVLELSPSATPVFSSLELAGEFEVVYRAKVFLVESGEELYMVMLVYRGFHCDETDYETRVYRMDFSEQPPRWRKAGDLAGGAFLLAPWYFGATCSAGELGLCEDCVYAFVPGDDEVSTCLKMSSVKDGWDDFVDVPAAHRALWILPTNP